MPQAARTCSRFLAAAVPDGRGARAGQAAGDDWDAALATLNAGDPHRVFSNAFLDTLLP